MSFITREEINGHIFEVKCNPEKTYMFYINGCYYAFHYNKAEAELFTAHVRLLLEKLPKGPYYSSFPLKQDIG